MVIRLKLDQEKFDHVKEIQLEILLEFDRICKENEIHYNIYYGTMLGAIRHQAFIPWDDDIDLAMTRENYDKFLNIYEGKLAKDYFVQDFETDPDYPRQFIRIRKNGTKYLQRYYKSFDIHHGIFIDVFPYDHVYLNQKKEKYRYKYLKILNRINIIKHFGVKSNASSIKKSIQKMIDRVIPTLRLKKHIRKVMTKRNQENLDYMTDMTLTADPKLLKNYLIKEEDFLDSVMVEFENHQFPVPRKYDKYLTQMYGDYMKYPPKEERVPHHEVIEIEL